MLRATIVPKYVNQPKPGKKTGTVKTGDDKFYHVLADQLVLFRAGVAITVDYETQEFKNTRTFQMPACVEGIKVVYELTGGSRVFGIHDPDMQFDRLMAADLYLTPLSSDQITYRTIQWSFWDMSRAFNLRDIQVSFNLNTKRLVIIGRDPVESLFVTTMDRIPDQDFYEDPLVIKWFIAKAKISLARILGMFSYNMLGNVTINYADIRQEGQEELAELKEKIAGDNTPDYFMMFN